MERQVSISEIKEDGWTFFETSETPTVICAERKLNWYDEGRFEAILEALSKKGCRVFIDRSELPEKYKKGLKRSSIAVYKKFSSPMSMRDKIEEIKTMIKNTSWLRD